MRKFQMVQKPPPNGANAEKESHIYTLSNEPVFSSSRNTQTSALSEEQQKVVDVFLKAQENVFLTGAAGTGKTFTVNFIINQLKNLNIQVYITAMTGIAGTLISGTSLHSFAGIGYGDLPAPDLVKKIRKNKLAETRWKNCQVLVIDEISMLSRELFEKLNEIARSVRGNSKPFGGIQILLVGDFFQLPPIAKKGQNAAYCFESPIWFEVVKNHFELTVSYRAFQQHDLNKMLKEIRENKISSFTTDLLNSLKQKAESGLRSTKLFCTNISVDDLNENELAKLPKDTEKVFQCYDYGNDFELLNELDKSTLFPKVLRLRIGCQVMLLKNLSRTRSNGTRGTVIGYDGESRLYPIVKFYNGEEDVIREEEISIEKGNLKACRTQIPLKLAYAMTIHKSQGMSLDTLNVELNQCFAEGQAYVALSRARNLEGLFVTNYDVRRLRCSEKVKEFYEKHVKSPLEI